MLIKNEAGTQEDSRSTRMEKRVQIIREISSEVRLLGILSDDGE